VPIIICVKIAYLGCRDTAPVIFKQERIGKNGEKIYIYKIRSMVHNAEQILEELLEKDPEIREEYLTNKKIENDPRITKIGKFIRKTSIDELPQLFNILKGDMSIVGPRPQLVRDMVFMTKEQRKRHRVRPGLSGLSQVKGRNTISWESKLNTDLEYIDKITFWSDLKIVFQTFIKIFTCEGITEQGMATATDYGDYLLAEGKIDRDTYWKKQKEAKEILR